MKDSDHDKKKPTPIQAKKSDATTEPTPAHPEQAMKTALDITLQKARAIREKYSEEEHLPKTDQKV